MVREYFVKGFSPSGLANSSDILNPSAALVKAVIIHSAQPVKTRSTAGPAGRPGMGPSSVDESQYPNIHSGYGQVQLSTVLRFPDSVFDIIFFDRLHISHGNHALFCFNVRHTAASQTKHFRVSLVWTDPPGDPMSSKTLVNDLDLIVHTPSGQTLFGNALSQTDETHGPYSVRDMVNNAEQVRVADSVYGIYTVSVIARDVAVGPQIFALVASASSMLPVTSKNECRVPTCPNQCSGKGECSASGECRCYLTHGGLDCSMPYKDIPMSVSGTSTPTALSVTWLGMSYYTFDIKSDSAWFTLSIVKGSQAAHCDADFFISRGGIPTRVEFDGAIADSSSSGTFQSVGNAVGLWVFGLHAYEGDVHVLVSLTVGSNDQNITKRDASTYGKTVLLYHQQTLVQNNSELASLDAGTCDTACSCRRLTTSSGIHASTVGMDGMYPNDLHCWWIIAPDENNTRQISLRFDSFATEDYYDTVDIYECSDTWCRNSSKMETISGTGIVLPYTIYTSEKALLVRFETDHSGVHRGFSATWWSLSVNTSVQELIVVPTFPNHSTSIPSPVIGPVDTSVDDLIVIPTSPIYTTPAPSSTIDPVLDPPAPTPIIPPFAPAHPVPPAQTAQELVCTPPRCTHTTQKGERGVIQHGSPHEKYKAYANHTWFIEIPNTIWVSLRFTWLDTEQNYDFVTLYECGGVVHQEECLHPGVGRVLARVSGLMSDNTLSVSMDELFMARGPVLVHFTSDSSIHKRGFRIMWTSTLRTAPSSGNFHTVGRVPTNKKMSFFSQLWAKIRTAFG